MLQIPVTVDSCHAGQLHFQPEAIRRLSLLRPGLISITGHECAERREVEAFIEQVYAKTYGALIGKHYPTLVSVRDSDGRILAALGFRMASGNALFLEQYMDMPVEEGIRRAFGCAVERHHIAEVGNLASAGHGAAVFLFVALMAYLECRGFSHIALTGTKILRGYFQKLGLDPRDMGNADPKRLPDHGKSWGSYYDTEPRLIAGDIHASYRRLKEVMLVEQICESGQYHAMLHPEAKE